MEMIIKCLNKTIQIKENNFYEMESYLRGKVSVRLRVAPHFSSGIVEWAKRERAWKSPQARKSDTRRAERKMRDYRQSPSFWTIALLSQRKTLIGSSMEICQHLSKTRQPLSALDINHNLQKLTRAEQIT